MMVTHTQGARVLHMDQPDWAYTTVSEHTKALATRLLVEARSVGFLASVSVTATTKARAMSTLAELETLVAQLKASLS